MFEVTDQQIWAWLGNHLFPMFRIASFMMIVPVLGTRIVPARVRLILALLMTVAVAPTLPQVPPVDPLSLAAVRIIMQQVFIGLAMGFSVILLFQLFVVAGQMFAMQMGLGFASMVDPVNGVTVTAMSQVYLIMVTLLYLSMNGHLVVFEVVIESFRLIPISSGALADLSWWYLASRISWMFASALTVALPIITALLIVNISFGVATRAAPQMNIFSLGFPITVILGLVIYWLTISGMLPPFTKFSEETLSFMRTILVAENGIPL